MDIPVRLEIAIGQECPIYFANALRLTNQRPLFTVPLKKSSRVNLVRQRFNPNQTRVGPKTMKRNLKAKYLLPLVSFALLAVCGFFIGCQHASEAAVESAAIQESTTPNLPVAEEKGMLGKASDLLNKAKDSSGQTAQGASKWVQDRLGGAAEAGGQSAEDSMKWANETFQSLKDQGLTSASDTGEWLTQDWRNMESWEYDVKEYENIDEKELVKSLNEMGVRGWECFNVQGNLHYFKKPTHSYLRQLPFKDLLRLIPLMDKQ